MKSELRIKKFSILHSQFSILNSDSGSRTHISATAPGGAGCRGGEASAGASPTPVHGLSGPRTSAGRTRRVSAGRTVESGCRRRSGGRGERRLQASGRRAPAGRRPQRMRRPRRCRARIRLPARRRLRHPLLRQRPRSGALLDGPRSRRRFPVGPARCPGTPDPGRENRPPHRLLPLRQGDRRHRPRLPLTRSLCPDRTGVETVVLRGTGHLTHTHTAGMVEEGGKGDISGLRVFRQFRGLFHRPSYGRQRGPGAAGRLPHAVQ